MSYSFSVVASTKDEAKEKIAEEFAEVVKSQPNHSLDRDAAVAAGGAFVDMLGDVPDGHEILVNVYGSLGWTQDAHDAPMRYISASVSVGAQVRKVV